MQNAIPTPQLGFMEAIKLASGRITDFKGRSRRSEFWWWMLVVLLLDLVIGFFIPTDKLLLDAIVSTAVMALGLSATARRLQDGGHTAAWVHVSFALGIFCHLYPALCLPEFMTEYMSIVSSADPDSISGSAMFSELSDLISENIDDLKVYILFSLLWFLSCIPVVVFCCMDGEPMDNAYGKSPKYEAH